ncbi:Hypothetical protein R9X50_00003100 [Acrodontium crateriforme]|uniref:Glycosyl hydrolase family 92 N-terminal domain-containing protein n=1 Tax=Acrodontium crateriforme TaxID=150365 RepID=A0AAQ3LY00_9PEZI|nr:Hypothetical protein R9X50_00003100 [Acrodontium crateriforme]
MRTRWLYLTSLGPVAQGAPYHDDIGVLKWVNPKIGTYGLTPNGNGGMIPSTAPPFAMTRWTPQTRENFISQCPYNDLDRYIHGFQGTHQPAIWMDESGQVVLSPGVGEVKSLFEQRAHAFEKKYERSTAYVYEVQMDARAVEAGKDMTESIYSPVPGGAQPVPSSVSEGANGRTRRGVSKHAEQISCCHNPHYAANNKILAAMTGTSHVGLLNLKFDTPGQEPYVFVQATRKNWTGHIEIDCEAREISGSNNQRQDYALGALPASGFSGYFVSRFSHPFKSHGIADGENILAGVLSGKGSNLGGYVTFGQDVQQVEVRTGVSFVSVKQARRNLDIEAPFSVSFDQVVENLKEAWLEKLGRVTIESVNKTDSAHDQRTLWYTGLFHALQYPSDFSEPLGNGKKTYYSGYTDSVHVENDSYYQSWSI